MLLVQDFPHLRLDMLQHVGAAFADRLPHLGVCLLAAASLSNTLIEPIMPSSKVIA
jgi:hypothetical protein